MKVNYIQNSFGEWFWNISDGAMGIRTYTRRQDAVRGFRRFCAAIKKAGA